jgi:hypothetical protein
MASSKVISLRLTPDQEQQLTPVVNGLEIGQNVLFVASVTPFWSPEQQETFWELQTVKLSSKIANKIIKLIRESKQ